jgi:hypothetical protein
MSGGYAQLKGGKRTLHGGKCILVGKGDPCCCGPGDCPDCGGGTVPLHFTCTLAAVSLAQGCSDGGGPINSIWIDQATLAGTFTLTRRDALGDPLGALDGKCVWFYGETPGVTVSAQSYANVVCNNPDTKTGDFGFYVELSREGTQFVLRVWLGNADLLVHELFFNESNPTDDCDTSANFVGGPPATYVFPKGGGGTATVTPAA